MNLITVRSKPLSCIFQLPADCFFLSFCTITISLLLLLICFFSEKNEQLEIPMLDKSNWRTISQSNQSLSCTSPILK